jgi:hypothetical protein
VKVQVEGWKGGVARRVRRVVRAGSSVEVLGWRRGTRERIGWIVVFEVLEGGDGELEDVRRGARTAVAEDLNFLGFSRGDGAGLVVGQVMV